MAYANDRWMTAPGTITRARGGEPGRPPVGGIDNARPTVVAATTTIVRFGGKQFDPVVPGGYDRVVFGQKVHAQGGRAMHGGHGLFDSARYGEWWMALQEFHKVERFAARTRVTIGRAMRQLCFVPREWSDLGTLIQGRLVEPLQALTGIGNAVTGIGAAGRPQDYPARTLPDEQIAQLFIPGLANFDFNRSMFVPTGNGMLATADD